MSAIQFLSTLPAVLGLTGFAVYYFLLRNRSGDRITLDIIGKLRQSGADRLPGSASLDPSALAKLLESDVALRSKISEQDFRLLRDALRQQFLVSLLVYGLCALMFAAGLSLYVYTGNRPVPLTISSIAAESADPAAESLPVDIDTLRVTWTASGDPEDVAVSLETLDGLRRTAVKTVRSTEAQVLFSPEDFQRILPNRNRGGQNRLRVLIQSTKSVFSSREFLMRVGITILAVHIEPLRIKISGIIDNQAIPNYDFDAKLLLWATAPHQQPAPVTYGGHIQYGQNDLHLDPALHYDWSTAKLAFLGPDRRPPAFE